VADAGGNDLLIVDNSGTIDWIATLPVEIVSTDNIKNLVGCPAGPPNICNLPAAIPAQPVATSVAIGPDGAYYIGRAQGLPRTDGSIEGLADRARYAARQVRDQPRLHGGRGRIHFDRGPRFR